MPKIISGARMLDTIILRLHEYKLELMNQVYVPVQSLQSANNKNGFYLVSMYYQKTKIMHVCLIYSSIPWVCHKDWLANFLASNLYVRYRFDDNILCHLLFDINNFACVTPARLISKIVFFSYPIIWRLICPFLPPKNKNLPPPP